MMSLLRLVSPLRLDADDLDYADELSTELIEALRRRSSIGVLLVPLLLVLWVCAAEAAAAHEPAVRVVFGLLTASALLRWVTRFLRLPPRPYFFVYLATTGLVGILLGALEVLLYFNLDPARLALALLCVRTSGALGTMNMSASPTMYWAHYLWGSGAMLVLAFLFPVPGHEHAFQLMMAVYAVAIGIMVFAVHRTVRQQILLGLRLQRRSAEVTSANQLKVAILDNVGDAIVIVDEAGIIRAWNQAATRTFGYDAGESVGMPVSALIEGVAGEWIVGRRLERIGRRKDGDTLPVDLHVAEVRGDAEGRLRVCLIRDLTEAKLAQGELASLNRSLVNASRQAGKAEIATTVLHNVGNVLNSVTTSAGLVQTLIQQSKVTGFDQISKLLREHEADVPAFVRSSKGGLLLEYLHKVSAVVASERREIIDELDAMRKNIEHIEAIVASQQANAKRAAAVEALEAAEVIEHAVELSSLGLHDLRIVREFAALPVVNVDRHKLLQIVINLLANARDAIDESARGEPRIVLRLYPHAGCRFRIEVEDSGCGIPADRLTAIFGHGFTTKKRGNGFGLHASVCAAIEMGGSLSAHSDGAGRGARFTLELPLSPEPAERPSPDAGCEVRSSAA